ncbi:MAG TPA: triose-phosphate isomerase [archaeon]|nr:triose-phosphate isomerase [archaeon]
MELPLILINFKCYEESTGQNALKLAKACRYVSKKFNVNISVSPQYTDIQKISKLKIPIFAQHIDPIEVGAYTGHVTALAVKEAGVVGSLISHSERKLTLEEIGQCIGIARKYQLISVVCSDSLMKSKDVAMLNPDFIAYEPPELIGTGVSVSKTRPEVVSGTVNSVKNISPSVKVLCGAGITNGEDVKKAIELGAEGVLVASGVVKAPKPKKVLKEFARAIKP